MLDPVKDKDLISRLNNFKFRSAVLHLRPDHNEHISMLVHALNIVFGNSGWLDGHMNTIVYGAVQSLMPVTNQSQQVSQPAEFAKGDPEGRDDNFS